MSANPTITVAELAALLGASYRGDGARIVCRIETLDQADHEALSWLGNEKYLPSLMTTRAGAVLLPEHVSVTGDWAAIFVSDPDVALCEVLRRFAPSPQTVPPEVHPSAVIAPTAEVRGAAIGPFVTIGDGAVVGAGTQVHAGVSIGAGARIGVDCVLWPNVVIRERCILGDRVIVHAGTAIGTDGFGYLQRNGRNLKIPQVGIVVIEDDVEIGSCCCIDRARSGETRIGRGTKIDNLVQVGHNVLIGQDCIVIAQCGISGSSELGDRVLLAAKVGVSDHCRIGDGARIGGYSGVKDDVPPGASLFGIPATNVSEFARQFAALKRLPKLLGQVRDLLRRVEQLESSKDD